MNRTARAMLIYLAFGFAALLLVNALFQSSNEPTELTLSEFQQALADDQVDSVLLKQRSDEIVGEFKANVDLPEEATDNTFRLNYPDGFESDITEDILAADVPLETDAENPTGFQWFLGTIFPYLLIFGIFIFFIIN